MKKSLLIIGIMTIGINFTQAAEQPCKDLVAACKKAGFVEGKWKEGIGLHKHCIQPLLNGASQAEGAKIALPKVDGKLVEACKEKKDKRKAEKK